MQGMGNSFRYLCAKNYQHRTWFDRVSEKIKTVHFFCLRVYNAHMKALSNLKKNTDRICRPIYNRSQTKRPSAILNLQNFDTLICDRSWNQIMQRLLSKVTSTAS